MVKLIMGLKGSGKTKKLIELLNAAIESENGDIIFIPQSNKLDFHQDILPLLNVYNTYKAITD